MTAQLPVTGNTEQTRPENRAFYPALDGLRAIAFLMVFLQHYAAIAWGWSGVNFFFVLSGFLITGILFDSRDDAHRARNFYVRRTLRIFPLYYGVMLLLVLLYPTAHWQWSWDWVVWPAYLGNFARFVHPYIAEDATQRLADFQLVGAPFHSTGTILLLGHFWSLCVEEQFYLFWPWVVFFVRSRKALLWICATTLPLCLVARLLAEQHAPAWMLRNELLYRVTPFQLDSLLLGGLLALLLRGPHARTLLRAGSVLLVLYAAAFLIWPLLSPSGQLWHTGEHYVYPSWRLTWGLTAVNGLAAALILCALQPRSPVYRVLNLRPLRWVGRISYGAYVWHDVFHLKYEHIVRKFAPAYPTPYVALLALASTLLLSWLSFRWFESLFLNLKEKLTIRSVTPTGKVSAAAG